LEEFFDYRWKYFLPTFVTTNLTPKQLRSWSGWERIVDRPADPDLMISVIVPQKAGENDRLQAEIGSDISSRKAQTICCYFTERYMERRRFVHSTFPIDFENFEEAMKWPM